MTGGGAAIWRKSIVGGGNRQCEALKWESAWWRGSCTEMVFSLITCASPGLPELSWRENSLPEAGPRASGHVCAPVAPQDLQNNTYSPWDAHRYPLYLDLVPLSSPISAPAAWPRTGGSPGSPCHFRPGHVASPGMWSTLLLPVSTWQALVLPSRFYSTSPPP